MNLATSITEKITYKPIIYLDWITEDTLREHKNDIFVFGDNMLRKGYGGQAKVMRGKPNTLGIVTKRAPDMNPESFFEEEPIGTMSKDMLELTTDLMKVVAFYLAGRQIYAPKAGLGTERARLKEVAPTKYGLIVDTFRKMSDPETFPWKD